MLVNLVMGWMDQLWSGLGPEGTSLFSTPYLGSISSSSSTTGRRGGEWWWSFLGWNRNRGGGGGVSVGIGRGRRRYLRLVNWVSGEGSVNWGVELTVTRWRRGRSIKKYSRRWWQEEEQLFIVIIYIQRNRNRKTERGMKAIVGMRT